MTAGSTGQPVPHPLLAVEAQLRREVTEHLATLHLYGAGWHGMAFGGQLTTVAA